jgi:Domain of unknown function (DUF4386)
MTITMIDESQRIAAKVAGLAYLITFATVIYVNFGVHDRLIVDSNAETVRNILAHETLFRIGIVGDLIYCAGVVVLVTALYIILKPVSPGLALLAALGRLIFVLMWLAVTLNLFDILRLLAGTDYAQALGPQQLQAFVSLHLSTRFDYYYVGLLFGASASTICGYLWLKSRYIPQLLAGFGLISSAWCVACTLVFYVYPKYQDIVSLWWFDIPMAIFDIALSFWLLLKGLRAPAASPALAQTSGQS